MTEKIICITTPTERTYYKASTLAKEFVDRDNNIVHTKGAVPDGKITEFTVSTATVKHVEQGKLNGTLEVVNLADGSIARREEYKNGVMQKMHTPTPEKPAAPAEPLHQGTTLKSSKGTHSFYCNGKEVAEETISSNGVTLELLGNIPDGEVKEYNENDQVITVAQYKNNKLNGELVRYLDDGKVLLRENYVNGFLQGEATYFTFTKDCELISKCSYKHSRLDGERTFVQSDGILRCREFYKNGHLNGPRTSYYPNGNKETEAHYTDGKLIGKREFFFPNGSLWYTENYSNDRLDGQRHCFYPSGKLYLEEFYADGLLEGPRNIYSETGELLSSEEYHWGSLVRNTERSKA